MDKRVNQSYGVVTTTRVRSREDVLILRPFPLWLYQRGRHVGSELLLQQLRGETIDWAAYRTSAGPAPCASDAVIQRPWTTSARSSGTAPAPTSLPCACPARTPMAAGRSGRWARTSSGCRASPARRPRSSTPFLDRSWSSQTPRQAPMPALPADHRGRAAVLPLRRRPCLGRLRAGHAYHARGRGRLQSLPSHAAPCHYHGGWFSCKTCGLVFPDAAGRGEGRLRRCLNCSTRSAKIVGEQTCRGCKKKFVEQDAPPAKRQRYCQRCRR